MKKDVKKIRFEAYFIVLFLVCVLIFSIFRAKIADYAAWLLAMTHEISLSTAKASPAKIQGQTQQAQAQTQEQQAPIKITALSQAPPPKNKIAERMSPAVSKPAVVSDKPVTVDLPKTDAPVIAFINSSPGWNSPGSHLFPPLRNYNGTAWNDEKTEIKMFTDGRILYLFCRLYDKKAGEAVIGDPKKLKRKGLWDTDCIEFFIMKNSKSNYYCQYILSASGRAETHLNKITSKPNLWENAAMPKSFELPRLSAEEFDGGFELEARIALSNIDIDMLRPGDSLLLQIVRNYRGQSDKNSVTTQLFPVYIYADSKLGMNNHDRRAFQPVQAKQDK